MRHGGLGQRLTAGGGPPTHLRPPRERQWGRPWAVLLLLLPPPLLLLLQLRQLLLRLLPLRLLLRRRLLATTTRFSRLDRGAGGQVGGGRASCLPQVSAVLPGCLSY